MSTEDILRALSAQGWLLLRLAIIAVVAILVLMALRWRYRHPLIGGRLSVEYRGTPYGAIDATRRRSVKIDSDLGLPGTGTVRAERLGGEVVLAINYVAPHPSGSGTLRADSILKKKSTIIVNGAKFAHSQPTRGST